MAGLGYGSCPFGTVQSFLRIYGIFYKGETHSGLDGFICIGFIIDLCGVLALITGGRGFFAGSSLYGIRSAHFLWSILVMVDPQMRGMMHGYRWVVYNSSSLFGCFPYRDLRLLQPFWCASTSQWGLAAGMGGLKCVFS